MKKAVSVLAVLCGGFILEGCAMHFFAHPLKYEICVPICIDMEDKNAWWNW